ncbi:MAG: two-component system NtrC family sensor kinase [Gammaproteobacteria bacterium]|jgi:two-component system NtrC family sensor kinase
MEKAAPFYKRASKLIRSTVRYRLLALVLFPILLMMPIALITAINWGKNYTYKQLFIKVKTDLSVSHDTFNRIQKNYLDTLVSLSESYAFQSALNAKDDLSIRQQVADLRDAEAFSFLNLVPISPDETGSASTSRDSSAFANARSGIASANIEIYNQKELNSINSSLAELVRLPLIETARARPTTLQVQDRAMVIRTLYPVKDRAGKLIGILDGGVLLNANFGFVDAIRDLVYAPGNLPAGSIGTVTVFLDDVRISTNVPLKVGERALGTRVSNEVRSKVLDNGETWIDRAFVVNDWYISSYEPIIDVEGLRVGMLYAGFLEKPFRHELWKALAILVSMLLTLMLLSAWLAIRGAKLIFKPIEKMSDVIHATQKGFPERVGFIDSDDELGLLAEEFDAMLEQLEQRKQELQDSADQLESKVVARTAELQNRNDDLSRTIGLLRETRQQLVVAEKLAALGELTAGVAHEINNPTAVILGSLDVMAAALGKHAEPVKEEIEIAIEQVYRIKAIIDNLLQYAKPNEYAGYVGTVNVNALIDDSLKLIRHLENEKTFHIELELKATIEVEINAEEFQQVIVNLIINAFHSLPSNGDGLIHIQTQDWGEKGVIVRVKDNGRGIAKKEQEKIFNPFFSTKEPGKGSGLGLSVCYSLIRRFGGNITVKSDLSNGTKFYVWLLKNAQFTADEKTITEQLLGIEESTKEVAEIDSR